MRTRYTVVRGTRWLCSRAVMFVVLVMSCELFGVSATESIANALANVRSRYKDKLCRYGLTESYFDETSGICDLMLLDVPTWTKYQIVYYRETNQIEWPRIMTKSAAEDLMQDRLIIHAYECALDKEACEIGDEENKAGKKVSMLSADVQSERNALSPSSEPIHEVGAANEKAQQVSESVDPKDKGRVGSKSAQHSNMRQMTAFVRKIGSEDEIAKRFRIGREKQRNAAHSNNLIRVKKSLRCNNHDL